MNHTTEVLLKGGAMVKLIGFPEYVNSCIKSEIELLLAGIDEADKNGSVPLTKDEVLGFYTAETKVKAFFKPAQIKRYDYQFMKKMKKDNLIKTIPLFPNKSKTQSVPYEDQPEEEVEDYESQNQYDIEYYVDERNEENITINDDDEKEDESDVWDSRQTGKKLKYQFFLDSGYF